MFEFIRLERTMCYGTCPVYSVQVDKYGNINYFGEAFVYKNGEHQWKISKKKVEQLNDLIENFGFKSFIYGPGKEFITDQPSCITTVKYPDGEIKEIDNYLGHILLDEDLILFEKRIERIRGTKKYVNPRLYIYQIKDINSEPSIMFIVISSSEKEAIDLIEKEYDNQKGLEWQANKIGVATDDYYGPTIVMKNNEGIA